MRANWKFTAPASPLDKEAKAFLQQWDTNAIFQIKSSGTTGSPQICSFQKQQLLTSATASIAAFGLDQNTRALLCLPTSSVGGLMLMARALVGDFELFFQEPSSRPLQHLDQSIDFITAGQAFHWFKWQETKAEFKRILKPNGIVALVWNERQYGDDSFESAYDALMRELVGEYNKVVHTSRQDALDSFFNGRYQLRTFPHQQIFDFESLQGRFLSSSYAPLPNDANYETVMAALKGLFDRYAENGRVTFHYNTHLYYDTI